MKKKALLFSSIIIVAVLAIVGVLIYYNSTSVRLNRQMKLAQKYITEENFEQAVVAYSAAIKIDPKCEDAYEGLAGVYVRLERWTDAFEVLQNGINATGSTRLKELLGELTEKAEKAALVRLEGEIDDIVICGVAFPDIAAKFYSGLSASVSSYLSGDRLSDDESITDVITVYNEHNFEVFSMSDSGNAQFLNSGIAENHYARYVELPDYFHSIDLNTTREDIVAWCEAGNLPYAEDSFADAQRVIVYTERYMLSYVIYAADDTWKGPRVLLDITRI